MSSKGALTEIQERKVPILIIFILPFAITLLGWGLSAYSEQNFLISNWSYVANTFIVSSAASWVLWKIDGIESRSSRSIRELKERIDYQGEFWSQGIVDTGEVAHRILRCDPHRGLVMNDWKIDAKRNVIFNVNTAKLIIEGLNSAQLAFDTGRACGVAFGGQISKRVDTENTDLFGLLDRWSKFDAMAGFGRFQFERIEQGICVRLTDNFLSHDLPVGSTGNCDFITGYIDGFMHSIPRKYFEKSGYDEAGLSVEYDHAESECQHPLRLQGTGCSWTIHLVEKTDEVTPVENA